MPEYLTPGVYVEEIDTGSKPIEGVGTSMAAFVGFTAGGTPHQPELITNWSQFCNAFGDENNNPFVDNSYMAHAVYGYFNNGGSRCYCVKVPHEGMDREEIAAKPSGAMKAAAATVGPLQITAAKEGEAGNAISVELQKDGDAPVDEKFKVVVKEGGKVVEEWGVAGAKADPAKAVSDALGKSKYVKVAVASKAKLDEKLLGEVKLEGGTGALTVPGVADLAEVDFQGNEDDRTGMGGFTAMEDVTMLIVPDIMAGLYQRDANGIEFVDKDVLAARMESIQATQQAMLDHAENMSDRVAILDSPPGLKPKDVDDWRWKQMKYDSSYGALYYPWIKVMDPRLRKTRFVPPSGHMAGIWARSDSERGVHKAPANEIVRGAIGLEYEVNKGEQAVLNPHAINCIRAFPGRGIRVWGARTLSSDPSWRYLNVRRLFNFVEKSIELGTQWIVFEPNDMDLWERIKRNITAFLTVIWRTGALFGATPDAAFYVKCDAETNPPEQIDLGMVVTEIGICPVKPAEFVIFRIGQHEAGATVS